MTNFIKSLLFPTLVTISAGIASVSCTNVDDTLGYSLLPGDKNMVFMLDTLDGVDTYMAMSDSMPTSKLNRFFLGSCYTEGYGRIYSSAVLQYAPFRAIYNSEDRYGYKPYVDSVALNLYIADVDGDASVSQKFYIYPLTEVLEYDSMHYGTFPAEDIADMDNPLFSFVMRNEARGTVSKKLTVEPAGVEYLDKLMSLEDEVYDEGDTAFRKVFKGFYITPSSNEAEAPKNAALYDFAPISTLDENYDYTDYNYFSVYVHTHAKGTNPPSNNVAHNTATCGVDSTFVMNYSFDDTGSTVWYPNMTISTLRHDYSSYPDAPSSLIDTSVFVEPGTLDESRPESMDVSYVHGMLGVSSYLYFGGEFFEKLQALRTTADGEKLTLFVNRAKMYIYLENDDLQYLDVAPVRLGMFYRLAGQYPLTLHDYMYYEEATQSASTSYDGALKRGMGYYEMDISMYVSLLANDPENTSKEVWLAPDLSPSRLYTASQAALQNKKDPDDPDYKKRIRIELAYTLMKNK